MFHRTKSSWFHYLILVGCMSCMSYCTKNKALDDFKEPYDSKWQKVTTIDEKHGYTFKIEPIGRNAILFTNLWSSFLTDTSFKKLVKKHDNTTLNTSTYSNIQSDKINFFIVNSYLYATNSTMGVDLKGRYGSGKFWINNISKQLLMSLDASRNFEIADLSIEDNKVKIGELLRTNIPSSFPSDNSDALSFEDMFFIPVQNNLWRIKNGTITKVWDKGGCRDMAKLNDTIWTISNNSGFIFSVDGGLTFQKKEFQEFINADYSNIFFINNFLFYNGYYYPNFQNKKALSLLLGKKVDAFTYSRNGYMYIVNESNYKYEGSYNVSHSFEIWRHPL